MRYTKNLQMAVVEDIKDGMEIGACAAKYKLPEEVVIKWANLDYSFERAKDVTMHRYSPVISETEADITNLTAEAADCADMDDSEWDKYCKGVFSKVFNCVAKVVQAERKVFTSNAGEKDALLHLKVYEKQKVKNKAAFDEAAETGRELMLSFS